MERPRFLPPEPVTQFVRGALRFTNLDILGKLSLSNLVLKGVGDGPLAGYTALMTPVLLDPRTTGEERISDLAAFTAVILLTGVLNVVIRDIHRQGY